MWLHVLVMSTFFKLNKESTLFFVLIQFPMHPLFDQTNIMDYPRDICIEVHAAEGNSTLVDSFVAPDISFIAGEDE